MRLLGNKTKLLPQIEAFLFERGIREGSFLDAFSGTASVARHFRSKGFQVHSNDLMWSSYVMQRVHICLEEAPPGTPDLLHALNRAPPRYGLFARQFAEGSGRLYFSEENGQRIDGIHAQLVSWLRADKVSADQFYLLLLSLLEASDKVANISGTYGAFLKKLSVAANKKLILKSVSLDGRGLCGTAHRMDATALAAQLPVDVLYIDPPYNGRQYVKYYHVREILAELHTVGDLRAYEGTIYGKTGLRLFRDRMSDFCSVARCRDAFAQLLRAAQAKHIVVSYSEEGLLSGNAIADVLEKITGRLFDFERDHVEISYKRFRSDSDKRRTYSAPEPGRPDLVKEWLFYTRKMCSS